MILSPTLSKQLDWTALKTPNLKMLRCTSASGRRQCTDSAGQGERANAIQKQAAGATQIAEGMNTAAAVHTDRILRAHNGCDALDLIAKAFPLLDAGLGLHTNQWKIEAWASQSNPAPRDIQTRNWNFLEMNRYYAIG